MHRRCHRTVGLAVGVGTSVALSAPLAGAAVIALTARGGSMIPDYMERWFGVEQRDHRTWTHWLATTILVGLALGAVVYGIGYGAETLVHNNMEGREARHLARVLHEASVGMGILVAIGVTVGAMSHSLIDACTVGGVPLCGPFTKRKMWVVPRGLRTEVGDKEAERAGRPFTPTVGEKRWTLLANLTTLGLIVLTFAPHVVDFLNKHQAPS